MFWLSVFALFPTLASSAPALLGGEKSWCVDGTITQTTEECICPTHTGHFCQGTNCGSGFGMSFYHKSCTDCKCLVSTEWIERKQALAAGRPRKGGKKGGKGGKGKKEPGDDQQRL